MIGKIFGRKAGTILFVAFLSADLAGCGSDEDGQKERRDRRTTAAVPIPDATLSDHNRYSVGTEAATTIPGELGMPHRAPGPDRLTLIDPDSRDYLFEPPEQVIISGPATIAHVEITHETTLSYPNGKTTQITTTDSAISVRGLDQFGSRVKCTGTVSSKLARVSGSTSGEELVKAAASQVQLLGMAFNREECKDEYPDSPFMNAGPITTPSRDMQF